MISSMTGYAARARDFSHASLSVEIKSVNSRFLDLTFRLAEDLRQLEPSLREQIAANARRGKMECRMGIAPATAGVAKLALNDPLLHALADASRRVQTAIQGARPLSVCEVLHWPGMLADQGSTGEALREAALGLFNEAMQDFRASREREGAKLKEAIVERVADMRAIVAKIQPLLPEIVRAHQEKLSGKLREVLSGGDEDRIRQEMALYGVKIDIAEELTRLALHLDEVTRVLEQGGTAGKRLDFLMQELNREANTLGSKSVSKETSDASLAMKLLIEQMREQIQNIE